MLARIILALYASIYNNVKFKIWSSILSSNEDDIHINGRHGLVNKAMKMFNKAERETAHIGNIQNDV